MSLVRDISWLGHGDLHEKLLEKVEDDIFLLSGHDNTSYGGTL